MSGIMKKKTIGILLMISLVMIICISAISAADTDDGLLGAVSDTDIATTSVASEQVDNSASLGSDANSGVDKISVNDSRDEISSKNVGDASSNLNDDLLSSSNDDVLKAESNCFYWVEGNKWREDLIDSIKDVASSGQHGTIRINGGTYDELDTPTSDGDVEIHFTSAVDVTFEKASSADVIFDGKNSHYLFWLDHENCKFTFNNIIFKNGKAFQGGAFEVSKGQLTLNGCTLEGNNAHQNLGEGYGWGGAVYVTSGGSLIANNCLFKDNWAGQGGGAVCSEYEGSSAEFNSCTFEGNTQKYGGEKEPNDVYNKDGGSSSFSYCNFKGDGSLEIEVHNLTKSVDITPDINDDANLVVLYKGGSWYDSKPWTSGYSVTFSNLVSGTYTVYMMKNTEKKYIYSGNTFKIVEPNFVLNDAKVFETLSGAVNAIPNGGRGTITVADGTWTGSSNSNVQIRNKIVTIKPKIESSDNVIFSGDSQNYLLYIRDNSQLNMEDITITGKFSDSALKFNTAQVCTISDCEFKNIKNSNNQPGNPINAENSNLVLNDHCNFESNGPTLFKNTVVNIDGCTFNSNSGTQGGAINADSSSDLTVINSKFNSNEASEGGAIYASNLKVNDAEFTYNSAGMGGAVYITSRSDSLINMTNCVFDSNVATTYRNIYSESLTRKINLRNNEYDLDLNLTANVASYGQEYIIDGVFDWGSNLNNTYTFLTGIIDKGTNEKDIFGGLLTVVDNKFKINVGVLTGGTHEFLMEGMYYKEDGTDHFNHHYYYTDLYGNEFFLDEPAYAKTLIEKANITLNLEIKDVLIPEVPVLNVYANSNLNYSIFIGTKYYPVQVVNGKASIQLTGFDLGNYTVVGMRSADENYNLVMNFTKFSVSKTYSNFLVLSTNVEYDTLTEAVANSKDGDTIYVKKGTYADTGIAISNKTLDIIALDGAVFDAQGRDANFIMVNERAQVHIYGIAFRGLHNRNTNYGAIVNHGDLSLESCNFTDNVITKISFAQNGGAAVFSDGDSLEIENCTFIRNAAPLKVSTAAVTSAGHEDVSITSSKFINNSAREGGALHFKNISQFEAAVSSCEFEQNTAVKGSAIYVGNNSRYVAVTSSSFKKNDIKNNVGENTQLEGGVIYVNANTSEVTLDISISNFENNSNRNVDGGVMCLDGISKANIESCIFNNNKGKTGSVILIKNPYDKKPSLVIDSSNFINNIATNGAIATSPKVTTFIDECLFENNMGENRNIYSNGFTVVHDSILDVKDVKLNALSVQYGESSIINGTADIGTNTYAVANLTVANENILADLKNNTFSYKTDILHHGKYYATLNSIVDANNNTYLMDSITEIFRVNNIGFKLNVSVDNITYGETLTVVESLPHNVTGTIDYQLNGKYYTKDEIEALILDAGKYVLVASYDHEDYAFTYSTINFTVYKANPTITVADVEVEYNDTIILNIETNVPSIYIIEIEDYKNAVFVNGSRSVEIDKIFEPGNYTIKVTSQERVNYISNFTEATLKVNRKLSQLMLSVSNRITSSGDVHIEVSAPDNAVGNVIYTISDSTKNTVNTIIQSCRDDLIISGLDAGSYEVNGVSEGDGHLLMTSNTLKFNVNNNRNSPDNNNGGNGNEEGKFIFQYDEDSDYEYCDSLEEAIDKVELWGTGIITVRGGTYSGDEFRGIKLEGELEVTIKAFEDEVVIFDCENEDYFLYLTYKTEINWTETTPPIPYEKQTEGPTVTLQNITVINGKNSEGGAIEMDAGSLTLINCNFHNCNADYGGVIYIGSFNAEEGATLTGLNTTFTNNYASDEGGAIYISKSSSQDISVSFLLCTFLDNYQGEGEDRKMNYFGGVVGDIVRKSCIFNGAGVIYSVDIDKINQTVTINGSSTDSFDSVVLLYSGQTPLYSIYNNGSGKFYITFEDVMAGNYTVGVMNDHDFNTYIFGNEFEMKVPNFIISEEEVYENLTDAIAAVPENGIIYANANYYTEENMEIDIRKSFALKNFRNRDVTFDGSGEKWFFTIAEGYTVVFEGISFTDGAIKTRATIENYGNLIIKNCSFDSFETSAIIYNSGLMNILNSDFSLNSIDNAIVWNDADLVIDDVEFSSNIVNKSSAVYNNGVAEIINSNFTSNFNGGNGGAIYNTNSLIINNTVFNENEGMDGAAVYSTGTLNVFNSTFEDNSANGYGGAIFNGNEANIYNSTFTGGSSEKDGGAIFNNGTMYVDNSTFVSNSANGKGGAIYNNKTLTLKKSFFGINFGEFANIYNAGDIQFSENVFDFYDVILIVPDGQYEIPTTITGTLDPQFNMDIQVTLPGFVNNGDATVIISDGVFEYVTRVLPKGVYEVRLNEVLYDSYGNIYYGKAISDKLIINKANVYINLTVDDVVLPGTPVLTISTSKDGLVHILFNNKLSNVTITGGKLTLTLDSVDEGNYTVWVLREGDENYNDAVNATAFVVKHYEGKFIVNSTGNQFETLREALSDSSNDDVIYVREGTYSGADNIGLTISNKKLTIISLGDVVFDANSTDLSFLTVDETADVTLCDVVITGFNAKNKEEVILNKGNFTFDGCTFTKYNWVSDAGGSRFIESEGNLNIIDSEFYDNVIYTLIHATGGEVIINGSEFKNNTIKSGFISLHSLNSAKIISNVFAENIISGQYFLFVSRSKDVFINSEFYNNTCDYLIFAYSNTNMLVNNSIFIGNTVEKILRTNANDQCIISESVFTDNTAENVVLSSDIKLSVLESIFSENTLSDNGALNIASGNASVNGCTFANNKASRYRNIYSASSNVNITNSVFDALNVDYSVYDIDYGVIETIEGSIDIGTNLKFAVNLDINNKVYSVDVTDNGFTYNSGILNGGDYNVVLNPKDNNSNTFVFDKMTKIFTVNRIDPGLDVSIANITQGEKLKVNSTISKKATANVVYELNGNMYTKDQLENLTLGHGNYLVAAMYRGDKNYLPSTVMVNVEVYKITPNITVSDAVVNYGDEIKVNVTVDVADYYTVFIGNESLSLYVEDSAIFTFPSEGFKPDNYEIVAYVFETDDYYEAYGYANLTVNKAIGVFNLSDDTIIYGENATIRVNASINAYGNISYEVYDEDMELVYNITQSCLEELVVPNLSVGTYKVIGTFEGDSYYTNESIINSGIIVVNVKVIDLNITVSNITYTEDAVVFVYCDVDGEYLVYVGNEPILVTVMGGSGNGSVSDLYVGSYVVNATAVDGNYSAFNETIFEVTPKEIDVLVSVDDITYGEDVVVWVYSDVDGDYLVEVYGLYYPVTVDGGEGNTTISDLFVDEDILVSVSIVDGNYSAFNVTTFSVVPKEVSVVISVDDITYGEDAVVIVVAEVDGDYLVELYDQNCTVNVVGGEGNTTISDLFVDEDILVLVSVVDGNYSAFNTTTFNIVPKEIPVIVSVGNITYGEDAVVIVQSDVNGDYIVNILDETYTVSVNGGNGVKFIPGLCADEDILVSVSILDGNYTAFNATTFNVVPKPIDVLVSVDDITYGEDAVVIVEADVDGEYLVHVGEEEFVVTVSDGVGDVSVSNLTVGGYVVAVTVVDGNYSGFDSDSFDVAVKPIDVLVSAENIAYGETALVFVVSEIDGEYLVYVDDDPYIVNVGDGMGGIAVSNLTIGTHVVAVTVVDGNYSGFDSTSFEVINNPKPKENATISIDAPVVSEGEDATVTVTLPGDATGFVTIGDEIIPVNNGVASAVLTNLPVGNTDVPVTYSGDDKYNSIETSAVVTVNAKPNPHKENLTISAVANPISVGEDAVIAVSGLKDATGNVAVTVNGKTYVAPIVKGGASVSVPGLTENVTAVINYAGDEIYNPASTTVKITVNPQHKENATISIDVPEVTEGQNATISVTLPKDATGNVTATVGGKTYTVTVKNGVAIIIIPDLAEGNYTIPVIYSGDDKYGSVTKDVTVNVEEDTSDKISAPDVTKYYNGPERFVVTVTDYKGNPLANKEVTIKINGVTYTRTTNANGAASIAIRLNSGIYYVTSTVDNRTVNSVVTVLPTVNGTDLVKVYRNASQYYATFRDSQGNYLAQGTEVTFNINGAMYTRKVAENGLAKLNINLEQGEYIITAMNSVTGEMSSNIITVIPRIIENNDLTKYYRNASQYTVKIIGDDGKVAGAGVNVTFNVNGVFYTRQTNASGIAKLNINLEPGDYIITAECKGCKVSNNIKVLPTLTAKDLVKRFGTPNQFAAKLVDGQGKPYAGQKISFNINGVSYERTTNASGIAKLNINLLPGEYIITSSYGQTAISNKISVIP